MMPSRKYAYHSVSTISGHQQVGWLEFLAGGGRLTPGQAWYIGARANEFEGVLHLTTRQNIQLHSVPLKDMPTMLEDLLERGIVTYGASGDGIRSVKLGAKSGLTRQQSDDLLPLLWHIEEYFLDHPMNMNLPRKFKITLSHARETENNHRAEDLSIVRDAAGQFSVYLGGGLGALPQRSMHLADELDQRDLPCLLESIVQYFHDEGNRNNRSKARLKFLLKEKGEERFRQEVFSRYEDTRKSKEDRVRSAFFQTSPPQSFISQPKPLLNRNEISLETDGISVIPEKADGRYGLKIYARHGNILADEFMNLSEWVEEKGRKQLRISYDQNLLIPHLSGDELTELAEHIRGLDSLFLENPSIVDRVCPGVDYCALGHTSTQYLSRLIDNYFSKKQLTEEQRSAFEFNISGCQNSCAWAQQGDISLYGHQEKIDGVIHDRYALFVTNGDNGFSDCRERGLAPEDVPSRLESLFEEALT